MSKIATISGDKPLSNARHEAFCQQRALCATRVEAARVAEFKGSLHVVRGNAARLERRSDIQARIAYLARQDEDRRREKARKIEELYWAAVDANYADFWETAERPKFTKKGEPVMGEDGKPLMVSYRRPKPFDELPPELQQVIEGVEISKYGEVVPKVYSKMQAAGELRKMLGIGSVVERDEVAMYDKMSTPDIMERIMTLSNELGINVTVSVSPENPA